MRPAIHLSQVLRASKVACTVVLGVRTQGAWTSIACLLDSKHAAPRFPNILPSRSFYFGEPGNQSGLTSSIFQPRRVDGLQLDRSLCVLGQRIEYVKRVEASIAKFFLYHSFHSHLSLSSKIHINRHFFFSHHAFSTSNSCCAISGKRRGFAPSFSRSRCPVSRRIPQQCCLPFTKAWSRWRR